MKRYIFLILICAFISSNIKAQSFEWLQTVEIDYEYNPNMISYTSCVNPQGGNYFYGTQEHITFYNESMGVLFLRKIGPEGEEVWSRSITGQSSVKGITSSDAGDVYIAGQMLTDVNFWGEDSLVKMGIGTDAFIAKVSTDGSLLWSINLSSLSMGEGNIAELAIHGEMLYAAYSTWLNSYVLIFSMDGQYLQSVEQLDVNIISGITFDNEGNLYTTGSCAGYESEFGGVSHPAPFSYTTYLVKYNSDYQPEWVKFIEDITCTFPNVKTDGSGGIYFAGPLLAETLFDTINVNGPDWVYDFYLARLDQEGNFEWVVECPEGSGGDATVGNLHFLDTDVNGNAILAGFTRGLVDWGNDVVSDVTGNYQDIIIWSYSQEGMANWVKTAGGEQFDLPNSISVSSDGNAYIAGIISGEVAFDTIVYETEGYYEPFLAKLELDILSGISKPASDNAVLVYPNPAVDRISIINNEKYEHFFLLNLTGTIIKSGYLNSGRTEIDLINLAPGYYLFQMTNNEHQFLSRQIIVQ